MLPFSGSGGSRAEYLARMDELEARQVEADRRRVERRNALLDAWSDVRSWGLPLWRGVAGAGSAVALPFITAGRVGRAVDSSRAAGDPVGPAVRLGI